MQWNDLILPVAVSLIHETVASVDSQKTCPLQNGHLRQRFVDMLKKSLVKDNFDPAPAVATVLFVQYVTISFY